MLFQNMLPVGVTHFHPEVFPDFAGHGAVGKVLLQSLNGFLDIFRIVEAGQVESRAPAKAIRLGLGEGSVGIRLCSPGPMRVFRHADIHILEVVALHERL